MRGSVQGKIVQCGWEVIFVERAAGEKEYLRTFWTKPYGPMVHDSAKSAECLEFYLGFAGSELRKLSGADLLGTIDGVSLGSLEDT